MKTLKEIAVTFAIVFALFLALVGIHNSAMATAKADDYQYGCETVGWGLNFFGNWTQRRTICDGPRRADGSWERVRRIWTPAGYVRGTSYCGYYSCSFSEGYYRNETTQEVLKYVVFDSNVLPNEPQWLPQGTANLILR